MAELIPGAVVAHLDGLRRYARALTRDDVAADDLVHEALLRAIERAGRFWPGGSLRAWLAEIVHSQFVRGRRREAARRGATRLSSASAWPRWQRQVAASSAPPPARRLRR